MSKLDQLLKQQEQLKARIQKERAKQKKSDRKADTRRKILVGSLALSHMEKDSEFKSFIERILDEKLTRDMDRKLFGLQPMQKSEE